MAFDFKSATTEQQIEEYQRLTEFYDISYKSYKKYFDYLTPLLGDNEDFFYILEGYTYLIEDDKRYKGLIILLNDRIVLVLRRLLLSARSKIIYLNKINSIEYYQDGLTAEGIKIVDSQEKFYFHVEQTQDEIMAFIAKTHSLIQETYNKKLNNEDFIFKLERLAALFEKGLLTQEEFEQQKSKLLND